MNVFLTGATGFLGGELLVSLAKEKDIKQIYCLVRAKTEDEGRKRVEKIFNLHKDHYSVDRIIPVVEDLLDDNLTQKLADNKRISDTNVIIHSAANTSFSRIYDTLIEKTNIQGLKKIIDWSKTLKHFDKFTYIGTATICGTGFKDKIVYETDSPDMNSQHFVKYTYSKMMGEFMLRENLPQEKLLILRPSIIMGDSRPWVPRSYVILWTLASLNLLRLIPVDKDSKLDIIPVDYASEAITKLVMAKNLKYNTYHVSSGTDSFTTPLRTTTVISKYYNDRPDFKFIDRSFVKQMKFWASGRLATDNELNNYKNYLDYWEKTMGDKSKIKILFAGLEPYFEFIELSQIFDNSRLLSDIDIKQSPPTHDYVKICAKYLDNIDIFEGALDP
ncbi:MAG: hypothetical protein A2046_16045 [Bacteroidetes bacterium GWA2_30_7]|nr:MAG: hypothetical protein A2046_16045 [Bacteroidetes bacterium GWA2_30_7]